MMKRLPTTLALSALPALFLWTLAVVPLWSMLGYGGRTLWHEIFTDAYYQHRLLWTVVQAACTVVLTWLLSLPCAWTLARLQFTGKTLILRLLMLPFIMPTLVAGMGVLALFGEHGLLWRGWQDTPALLLYGNLFFNLPVAVRSAYQGFLTVPAHRMAAAQTLGANAWRQFWHVELPVLRPWLAGAGCLIFLYCFSGFGLALLLGGRQYATVEVEIYQLIAYELDMEHAAVLVWLVLAITAGAGILNAWFGRQTKAAEWRPVAPKAPSSLYQYALLALTAALLLCCCALPLTAIAWQAVQAGSAWRILADGDTWTAVGNTLRFSGIALIGAAALGILHAAAARRSALFRSITFLPFMISPVCLTFGALLAYPQHAGSLHLLLALYILMAYPFVSKDVLSAWDALPCHYAAAARTNGANALQTAWYVLRPLLTPALRRGMTFAAATGIGEFAATLFLSRPEWQTLTTLIYEHLGKVGQENYHKAMVLTFVLMALAGTVFLCLDQKSGRDGYGQ